MHLKATLLIVALCQPLGFKRIRVLVSELVLHLWQTPRAQWHVFLCVCLFWRGASPWDVWKKHRASKKLERWTPRQKRQTTHREKTWTATGYTYVFAKSYRRSKNENTLQRRNGTTRMKECKRMVGLRSPEAIDFLWACQPSISHAADLKERKQFKASLVATSTAWPNLQWQVFFQATPPLHFA